MARADLFPLPRLVSLGGTINCKGARLSRRSARGPCENELCNEAVEALNLCNGMDSAGSSLSTVHSEALEVIADAVKAIGEDTEGLSAREAASALLKGRLDDSVAKSGTTSMASYGRGDLSLPESVAGSPNLCDVLSSDARVYLQDIRQQMLRDADSLGEVRSGRPPTIPYMDPVLAKSRRRYIQFIKLLYSRGLIRYLTYRREEVATFSCERKTGVFVLLSTLGGSMTGFSSRRASTWLQPRDSRESKSQCRTTSRTSSATPG